MTSLPRSVRIGLAIVAVGVLAALALQLREPEVAFDPPERDGARVHDPDDVVDVAAVTERLEELEATADVDVVAVLWEDEQASQGQAFRGGQELLEAWDADAALSAVAIPGGFADAQAGRRYFGVEGDRFVIERDLRERIVDDVVPEPAADDDWTGAFLAAIDALADDLAQGEDR